MKKWPYWVLWNVFAVVVLFLIAEGAASVLSYALKPVTPASRHAFTQYDPLLGWVNIPGARASDIYGKGKSVTIDSRGFRTSGTDWDPRTVPQGKARVLCSGDSFTMGHGVDDADTWCRQLSAVDSRLETINLGQGGYGIDQSYLRYRRDAAGIRHQAHVLAVIADDFRRAASDNFLGYAKPYFEIRPGDGELLLRNVPVPRGSHLSPGWTEHLHSLRRLALVRGWHVLWNRTERQRRFGSASKADAEAVDLGVRLIRELRDAAEAEGIRFVFVYLPVRQDFMGSGNDALRENLRSRLAQLGIPFVDLTEDFGALPASEWRGCYQENSDNLNAGSTHYTEKGNRIVAELLAGRLQKALF